MNTNPNTNLNRNNFCSFVQFSYKRLDLDSSLDPGLCLDSFSWLTTIHKKMRCFEGKWQVLYLFTRTFVGGGQRFGANNCLASLQRRYSLSDTFAETIKYLHQWSYLGCQNSDLAIGSKFHHLALLALLVVLVSHCSNFHHWPLLAFNVVLVLH